MMLKGTAMETGSIEALLKKTAAAAAQALSVGVTGALLKMMETSPVPREAVNHQLNALFSKDMRILHENCIATISLL